MSVAKHFKQFSITCPNEPDPGLASQSALGCAFSGEDDEESDKEEDEDLDKKMGDLGEGQTDTLDERMWGDDEDEEEEEGSDKEEESGQGMDQVRRGRIR